MNILLLRSIQHLYLLHIVCLNYTTAVSQGIAGHLHHEQPPQNLKFLIKKQMVLWAKLKLPQLLHFTNQAPFSWEEWHRLWIVLPESFHNKNKPHYFQIFKDLKKKKVFTILETSVFFLLRAFDFYVSVPLWIKNKTKTNPSPKHTHTTWVPVDTFNDHLQQVCRCIK